MRIVFIADSLNNGAGIERISVSLMNSLSDSGYDVTVILLSDNKDSFFALNPQISVYSFGPISFPCIYYIRKKVQQMQAQYVIGISMSCGLLACAISAFTKGKAITWEHFHRRAGSKLGYYLRFMAALCSYRQIVLTDLDKQNYPLWLHYKISVIPNYTDICINLLQNKDTTDENIVLSIGRLQYNKRFDILLSIWKNVSKDFPQWRLIIVGTGPEEKRLKDLSKALGLTHNVTFHHPTPDIGKLYQGASMLVTTSDFEGFGLTLIEAKSFCLPVVAFEVDYGPKVIIRDGIDGYLIPWNDRLSYTEKMKYLMSDTYKRHEMGRAGHEDYKKRFSKESVLATWKNILK